MATTPSPRRSFNPSPKTRFLESDQNILKHRAMVDSNEFDRAMDTAQLEYVRYLCVSAPSDLAHQGAIPAAASCFQRIQGMMEFITVLRGLSEVPPAPKARPEDNLRVV